MSETAVVGLRERKKQRTRWALIDAALDLFLANGYESTTIDEIVAAVDVSQRTFFRYFATKEDVALSLLTEYEEVFTAEFTARPAGEPPAVSLRAALAALLAAIEKGDEEHAGRFRKLRRLVDEEPAIAAGELRRFSELERDLTTTVAARMGVAAADDPRPALIVGSFLAVVRIAFDGCTRVGIVDPSQIASHVRRVVEVAAETLPAAWSAGGALAFEFDADRTITGTGRSSCAPSSSPNTADRRC